MVRWWFAVTRATPGLATQRWGGVERGVQGSVGDAEKVSRGSALSILCVSRPFDRSPDVESFCVARPRCPSRVVKGRSSGPGWFGAVLALLPRLICEAELRTRQAAVCLPVADGWKSLARRMTELDLADSVWESACQLEQLAPYTVSHPALCCVQLLLATPRLSFLSAAPPADATGVLFAGRLEKKAVLGFSWGQSFSRHPDSDGYKTASQLGLAGFVQSDVR